eukprot:6961884-Alexandrium_andersonii.AAC.1
MDRCQRITARSILHAIVRLRAPAQLPQDVLPQDPAEQIAPPGFQRGLGLADAFGPAQDDQEPTQGQLQGARILEVIRAVPTDGEERRVRDLTYRFLREAAGRLGSDIGDVRYRAYGGADPQGRP